MMVNLAYEQWDESVQRVLRTLNETVVSEDDLFVRKLVNGTIVHNELYQHSSHESEDERRHFIYAAPFKESDLESLGGFVIPALLERCDRAARLEAEFLYWRGEGFACGEPLFKPYRPLEIARLLLDHYLVKDGAAFESLYTVLDDDRNKVIFFLKEVYAS